MRPAHIALTRRYAVETELCDATDRRVLARCMRFLAAGAIAALTAWTVAVTVGEPPEPIVTPQVTAFRADLKPDTEAAWMRAPLGIPQPAWIGSPNVSR